jgi:hypothetical protein
MGREEMNLPDSEPVDMRRLKKKKERLKVDLQ